MPIALFGKHPSRADYVHHAPEASFGALRSWFDHLPPIGVELAERRTWIFGAFQADASSPRTVFAAAPSGDSVGRAYPIVVAATDEARSGVPSDSYVPAVWSSFLWKARSFIRTGARMDFDQLRARSAELHPPEPSERDKARELVNLTFSRSLLQDVHARLFRSGEDAYAYNTLLTACATSRLQGRQTAAAHEPEYGRDTTVLDCPVRVDTDLLLWLVLARRCLPPDIAMSYVWTEEASPRALVSLGPPPPRMVAHLLDAGRVHPRVWPLTTDRPAAVAAAAKALEPVTAKLPKSARISDLVDALETHGSSR